MGSPLFSCCQVAALALWKLFDNFSMTELVSSMADMMARSFSKPEDWDDPTPTNSPSHTVSTHTHTFSVSHYVTPQPSQGPSTQDTVDRPTTTSPTANSPKVICMTELCCEEAFYWCQLCCYIHNKSGCGQGAEELLEQILPTTSEFCDYIQRYRTGIRASSALTWPHPLTCPLQVCGGGAHSAR